MYIMKLKECKVLRRKSLKSRGIVSDLKTNEDAASKVIIFSFLKNDCALLYEYFIHKLGSQNLVNMFTNITDDTSKKQIISHGFAVLRVDLGWSLPQ